MPLSAWDGVAWRSVGALHVWDGVAWRSVGALHVWDGAAWQLVFPAATANPQITFITAFADASSAQVSFLVNNDTQSVLVECEFFAGGFSLGGREQVQLIDTSPGGLYTSQNVVTPPGADSVTFYCTPFSGDNGTGVQGPEASASDPIP